MWLTLAFLEGGAIFAAVCGMIVFRARPAHVDWSDTGAILGEALAFSSCCLAAFYSHRLYDVRIVRDLGQFASRLLWSLGTVCVLLAAVYALFPEAEITRSPFSLSLFSIAGLFLVLRAVSYGIVRRALLTKRVLIIGTGHMAQQLVEEIEARPECRYTVLGVVDDGVVPRDASLRRQFLGPLERLDDILKTVRPDGIIDAVAERRGRLPVLKLLESRIDGIIVESGVEVYERLTGKLAIESLTPSDLIFSKNFRKSRLDRAFGRGISLLVAVIGLVALFPVFGLIALAIKLDSRGPVFFVQQRIGLHGRSFNLIKFRTMHQTDGRPSEWVKDNRDRITRVGRWLRKYRLDELPQFVNILRGEMNLVGPRPHPVSNVELFDLVSRNAPECGIPIPYYSIRSRVRPGITGWAQVRYRYANDLEEEIEKLRYDLYYIKHLSMWLDLRILFETIKIVLLGRESGASERRPPRISDSWRAARTAP